MTWKCSDFYSTEEYRGKKLGLLKAAGDEHAWKSSRFMAVWVITLIFSLKADICQPVDKSIACVRSALTQQQMSAPAAGPHAERVVRHPAQPPRGKGHSLRPGNHQLCLAAQAAAGALASSAASGTHVTTSMTEGTAERQRPNPATQGRGCSSKTETRAWL